MEYLDYYDGEGNYLGYKTRDEVHKEGLWHNTVHCWLYEMDGSVYFQIRSSSHKFYTIASGHVLKGETIEKAFRREINEEIGLDIDTLKFDPNEVLGVVKVKAKDALNLFKNGKGEIEAVLITTKDNKNVKISKLVSIDDFLVQKHENAYDKYKDVLSKVIEITK